MNYNSWFFNQHKYLTGNREGKITFNDTKSISMYDRYKTLVDMNSELLNEQPFNVIGNNNGFDKLIDLMGRSNYTFDDINTSLIDTYRVSLQNAMSRNLVNTHSVIFSCSNDDTKHVTPERFSHYWIIDVPFNQLHFGDRDEFIRQKLHEMHNTASGKYVEISDFINTEFTRILGFSIICTVNGYFSNDCMVAVDDKGFKFKIGWPYASDAKFIIYKLDESSIYSRTIPSSYVYGAVIPYSVLGNIPDTVIGKKCIINIYDKQFTKTTTSAPNFGVFTKKGLELRNTQHKTIEMIEKLSSQNINIDIYSIKYFHEVPNVYPAVNYYDIMDSRSVFTERYEYVKDVDGNRIVASSTKNINYLETCTPPIALDRDVNFSFNTIVGCISLQENMLIHEKNLCKVGGDISKSKWTYNDFVKEDVPVLESIYNDLMSLYQTYQQGAIITSLVDSEHVEMFSNLINNIKALKDVKDYSEIQKYTFDELYSPNYSMTVNKITEPFRKNALMNFNKMPEICNNYFTSKNSTRFNRPVAEQNFIALRYHHDEDCWLFDAPTIKHFNGIGNTFYIDEGLKGDELFKFFVLYTDTESPTEPNIDKFDINTVFDFDKFSQEVERHIGCIRYWDAENRLMKISKMLYGRYDDSTCVQVFSKILKRKLSGDDIIKIYPSDINYEPSTASSDNWDNYDENSERSPFAVNFLFYTLSMLNNNEDKLQAYFYRHLTNRKYNNRYSDIDISSVLDDTRFPISYSQYTISPIRLSSDCEKPLSGVYAYYGLPLINGSNTYEPYRYVFNVYDPDIKYPMISDNDINDNYYVRYDDITEYGGKVESYKSIINMGRLMTLYLTSVYDYISTLQTNYRTSYNQNSVIESARETINRHITTIRDFSEGLTFPDVAGLSNTQDIINSVIFNNEFLNCINKIYSITRDIDKISFNGRTISFIEFINQLISTLKQVYVTTGLDNDAMKRARMLYINLKKVNTTMNPYEYYKWLTELDVHILSKLDDMLAANENYKLGNNLFKRFYDPLREYIDDVELHTTLLQISIRELTGTLQTSHIDPITKFCDDVINHFTFDMFILTNIEYDSSISYPTKPAFVVINIPDDKHTKPPVGTTIIGNHNLICQPIVDTNGGKFFIRSIANICEYAFFDGETLNDMTMNVLDISGNIISTHKASLFFTKISSTADRVNTFYQIPNMRTTTLDFENNHESFEVVNKLIVNKKHADMNYEMLLGNRFVRLDHETELVLQPETWLQGSVDRLYIDNQVINQMTALDFSHRNCKNVFFKPSQVFHITPETGSINSIAGKYFEGQTIYLMTEDKVTCFPVVITSVDHSINKGFIEAKVDGWNSKWFEVNDPETITKYLTEDIECHVIDDNIRNFMDEFTDSEKYAYSNVRYNTANIDDSDQYTLPGDPLYVSTNASVVYNRLCWMFNELVPDRFINDEYKRHKFIYVTSGFINNTDDVLNINMLNHDFNQTTNPERYPVLRDEPNDHHIWQNEITTFNSYKYQSYQREQEISRFRSMAEQSLREAETIYEKEECAERVEAYDRELERLGEFRKRLDLYIRQLETPTTWYNVRSYEASLVYISNGRADKFSPSFISNIRDLPYSEKLEVFLYDWEHKYWIDPNTYEIDTVMVNGVKIDEHDDYSTNRVLYTVTIKPKENFVPSKKILVYFSYNKSDIFNDIEMNPDKCLVRFKPVLSLDKEVDDYDPYKDIRIRKHFNGYEKYSFDSYDEGIHIERINRTGKYTYAPTFRGCDIIFTDSNGDHDYTDIEEIFVPNTFRDVITSRSFHQPKYTVTIDSDIDSFTPNTNIKLICISNNGDSSYDGNISDIMFNAITSYDEDDNQQLTVVDSTLPNFVKGTYVCTVFQDDMYKPSGGVITITVDTVESQPFGDKWFSIPKEYIKYRELPNEFLFTIKNPPSDGKITVVLRNEYEKNKEDVVDINNEGLYNPFEYYYDSRNKLRLPISNTRIYSNKQRLVIDQNINKDIDLIKSPYIGICRYSAQRIPKDGLIDLTGYIPTPLSRDRYEFWINGRYIRNDNDLIILSPTSIQLCNMKSLKNFEVIELVDDMDTDSELFKEGNVYVDLDGNSYSSYRLAMLSNSKIRNQNIMFSFNSNNHKHIHDYTSSIIRNPNNHDIEDDILASINFIDDTLDYNQLYNIPSINGITIFHPKSTGLGLSEIPNDKVLDIFDKVWKYEAMTNPLFMMTHKDETLSKADSDLRLHVRQITEQHWNGLNMDTRGMFIFYATGMSDRYFSLYISKKSDGLIDDVNNTVKIIPFILPGVYVLVDSRYHGMWLHTTHENVKPVHIVNMEPN